MTLIYAQTPSDFQSHLVVPPEDGAARGFRCSRSIRSNEEEMWQRRRQRMGEFKGIELLGSAPGGPGVQVQARLDFEQGSQWIRLGWEEGARLAGMRVFQQPPDRIFMLVSAFEFAAFSLRLPEAILLRFAVDEKGQPTGLIFPSAAGNLTAAREFP